MGNLKLAIKEFFEPTLKCARLGHNLKTRKYKIRERCNDWCVAKDYKAEIDTCSRFGCSFKSKPKLIGQWCEKCHKYIGKVNRNHPNYSRTFSNKKPILVEDYLR